MNLTARRPWILAALALPLVGCAHQVHTSPDSARGDVVTLLPDADTGVTGRAIVSNSRGTVELARPRATVVVRANQAPVLVNAINDADVSALDTLFATLPPPPQHFTLNFEFDSDELTKPSRDLLVEVQLAVQHRPLPEVMIIGHTDTVGSAAGNITLGRRRANMIRALLVSIGLDPKLIEVVSHGESDLLIHTADGVAEPRNRRVEITVR
jgi:OOP family OmpA-OmpF porin